MKCLVRKGSFKYFLAFYDIEESMPMGWGQGACGGDTGLPLLRAVAKDTAGTLLTPAWVT